jgi:MtrB/PioB family decaheme-associated outer membrane protein
LLIGAGLTTARAADFPVKAVPPVDLGWWFHGDVEAGGRFFTYKKGGDTTCVPVTMAGQAYPCGVTRESLGKFYEYRDWRQGPFGNVILGAGSNDGLYTIGFWAKNIGYDDQSYFLTLDKAGEFYFNLGFDQTPHIYNDNATTIFGGVGSADLTVSPLLRTFLRSQLTGVVGDPPLPTTNAQRLNIANAINGNLSEFELGFQRYTGAVDGRWTPTDNWDLRGDYSRTVRDGTQPMGALTFQLNPGFSAAQERSGRIPLELPRPISDTTDQGNGSVEYNGATPWGTKFNVAAGGGFSVFQNDNAAVRFQNPWVPDGANNGLNPLWNQIALAPDNTAGSGRLYGGVDLPWKSRYTGAVQYTVAQQNEAFLPFTVNPAVTPANVCSPGTPACVPVAFPTISQNSLNGESDILLVNNVLTTQWTKDVKSTLRYRYFDYSNNTPDTTITNWIFADTIATENATRIARGTSYVKQNASGDVVWNPLRWLTWGVGGAWERWDRDHRDVNVTDEWTGKVFVNAKPWEMAQFRASYFHSERRYDEYEPEVESNDAAGRDTYRLFDMANRSRDKANFYLDFYLPGNVTITPTGGFRVDDYGTNPYGFAAISPNTGTAVGELGLLHDNSWNGGLEATWALNRDINFIASYTHEDMRREIMANLNTAMLDVGLADKIDTFLVGTNVVIVPDRLDWKASVTYSKMHATFDQAPGGIAPVALASIPTTAGVLGNPAFPDARVTFTRFDMQSKYKFDPAWTQAMGWRGEVYAKLRYVWERNQVTDWAAVNQNYLLLIGGTAAPYSKGIFMGWDNPNYDVQVVMASLGFKW